MNSCNSDLNDFLECSICLDTLEEPKILPCTHRFCRKCLHKQIEWVDTSKPHASFPCPQCRGLVLLKSQDKNEEFVDQLQTDRLLRNIIDSLKDDPDVCASHRMRREIVCYNCHEAGCLRCAWNRHRKCSKTGDYQDEVVRIENLLNESLADIQNSLRSIDLYVDAWTRAYKSFKNQLAYSSSFFKKYLQSKKQTFMSSVNCIRSIWDSFSKSNLDDSSETNTLLKERMEESFMKLNIDWKYEHAECEFDKISKAIAQEKLEASTRLTNAPDRTPLESLANEISEVLKLDKSVMVLRGEVLLLENKVILSKSMQRQLQNDTSNTPSSYLLAGLITHEQQICFDLKDEEEILENLVLAFEAADDQDELLNKLNELSGHVCPKTSKTERENYFTNLPSTVFQLVCSMFYISKQSLSTLANKTSLTFDVLSVDTRLNGIPCIIMNGLRLLSGWIISALKLMLKIILGFVLMFLVISIFIESKIIDIFYVLSGMVGLFLVYLLLNQKDGPSVFGQMEISMAARPRRRRRRRNAAIDFIPTTETYFQAQRHVVIAKRTQLK